MNIRMGTVFIPQAFPYYPMPVGTKAITPSIPNAQEKPGEGGERKSNQMQFSCLRKNPADNIKQRKYCMKNKEENIKETVPHTANKMSF